MAIKSQLIVQYDTKQLHLTREWYADAGDVIIIIIVIIIIMVFSRPRAQSLQAKN